MATETDHGGLLVLLEFSASDPSQRLSHALRGAQGVRTLELDLIGAEYGRHTDLDRRAGALADDVLRAGGAPVVVAASCAAAPILAPLARQLAERGRPPASAAAVDPGPVTDGHIRHTLGQIAAALELAGTGADVAALDLTGPPDTALERVAAVLREWIARFLASSDLDAADHHLVRNDLLDRYLRWTAFLLAAADTAAGAPECGVDVFLTDPFADPAAVFGGGAVLRRHRYPRRDCPALDRGDLLDDLRTVLSAAMLGR